MGLLLNAEIENMKSIRMFVDECSVESAGTLYLYKNKLMTKSEKLARIYKVIADKTLSFGCKIKSHHNRQPQKWFTEKYTNDIFLCKGVKNYNYRASPIDWVYIGKPRYKSDAIEIIGHPVMIGDVLDWLRQKSEERNVVDGKRQWNDAKERREQVITLCVRRLGDLSSPIDDNDDAIDFIYWLL